MLQRLNLVPPSAPAAAPAVKCPSLANLKPEVSQEIKRRSEILKAGPAPEWIFFCEANGALLTFKVAGKPAILLFTTPYAAFDYLRATGVKAEVRQIKFQTIPDFAAKWRADGAQSFSLDRCPRCGLINVTDIKEALGMETFLRYWAFYGALRSIRCEIKVREMMAHRTKGAHHEARAALEEIRDHIDCANPYVHQNIALVAGALNDEAGKAAAIQRLNEFGPQFAGKGEFSAETLTEAVMGLLASYGMLNPRAAAAPPPAG
jgi:hypothetical protein